MAADLAHLVAVTGEPCTRIVALATLSAAGLGQGTLLVTGASSMDHWVDHRGCGLAGGVRSAGHLRPPNVTLSTLTAGTVERHGADGIGPTGSSQTTRVNTLASYARVDGGTVKVSTTFTI